MSNINDKATVELFVNGEQAEQTMDRLRKKSEDLTKAIDEAKKAGDTKGAAKLRRELDKVTKELNRTESAAKGTGKVLENLDKSSIHGLRNALKHLEKQLRYSQPGSESWKRYSEQIAVVKGRLAELNEELAGSESLWSRFKTWSTSAWPALDLLNQWGGNVYGIMRDSVDAYASMDQEMANVRKFTGMAADGVADLNEEFTRIDTRTSREDLNKLAQEAGRLGKTSKEDVLGFVRAADKINVALDDLGDGATLTLSKLTGVFGVEEQYGTEQSLLKVGSVINELSQNCSASAPYLANFASRMGGVGAQAKLTIPQIMAFGAVLDANGQAVEASSTAVSQVIVRMMQEPAKYARVAGLDVKRFTDLLKTDVNSALLLFLETLQKAGGMDVLSPMFKDMGENGSRAIAALSTLATHIDQVKAQQVEANKAFEEGKSIDNEFAVQNTTVQASFDKAKKAVTELRVELGERLSPLMAHMISSSSAMIRGLLTLTKFLFDNKSAILSVVVAIVAYNVAANLAAIKTAALAVETKLLNAVFATSRLAVLAGSGAVALLHGNLTRATAAFKLFSRTLKLSPLGIIAGLAIGAATAIYQKVKATKEAREAARKHALEIKAESDAYRKEISDISSAAASYAKSEKDRLKALYKATQDTTKSINERIAAVKELQKTYPTAFGNLSQEEILAGKAATAYQTLATNIIKAARAKAAAEKIQENEKALLDFDLERETLEESIRTNSLKQQAAVEARKSYGKSLSGKYALSMTGPSQAEKRHLEDLSDLATSLDASLEKDSERLEEIIIKSGELIQANNTLAGIVEKGANATPDIKWNNPESPIVPETPTVDPESPDGGPSSKGDRFAEEKAWREQQEALERISYSRGESLYSEHVANMASITDEYYQKLLARTDLSEAERLKLEAEAAEARDKLHKDLSKMTLDEENRDYQDTLDRLARINREVLAKEGITAEERERQKKVYDEALDLAELNHLQNIVGLYDVGSDEYLAAQRKFHEKEVAARNRQLDEMAAEEQKFAQIKSKVFGMNQPEKDAEYQRQLGALDQVFNAELAAVEGNEAETLRITEAYEAAKLVLRKEYNQEGANDTEGSFKGAIAKSAEWLKSEGGQAFTGTMSTVVSGMSAIFSGLTSLMQAELQLQTAQIEKRYDKEIEYAQGNSYRVRKLEKQKEEAIAKEKDKANKKMFAMQVIMAVAQTAQNAIAAYGSAAAIPVVGHVLAPIAAAMAVAAGAIQIATIKKQQQASAAQGYSRGGFTKPGRVDEPAGVVHAGEWVASQKLLANPVARPMIEALDYAQRTNTVGSLRAEDVSRSITAPASLVRISEGSEASGMMVTAAVAMSRTVDNLRERLDEPFVTVNTVTGDAGIKQAQDEYTRLMNNVTPRSRRKK